MEAVTGYAVCLDGIVTTTGNGVRFRPPLKPAPESNVDPAWKKYQVFSRPAELLLARVREENAGG